MCILTSHTHTHTHRERKTHTYTAQRDHQTKNQQNERKIRKKKKDRWDTEGAVTQGEAKRIVDEKKKSVLHKQISFKRYEEEKKQ